MDPADALKLREADRQLSEARRLLDVATDDAELSTAGDGYLAKRDNLDAVILEVTPP